MQTPRLKWWTVSLSSACSLHTKAEWWWHLALRWTLSTELLHSLLSSMFLQARMHSSSDIEAKSI